MPNRIAIGLEYQGTNYHGLQKQKTTTQTIQGLLESALNSVSNEIIKSYSCGRTDSGVHAYGQVLHFDTFAEREPQDWVRGGNSLLPEDIRITWAKDVDNSFHARFSTLTRKYRYIIRNTKTPSALWSNRALWVSKDLHTSSMRKASRYLIGENDFSSFRGSGCQSHSPVRSIESITIKQNKEFIAIEISANSFLLNMVRIIVGTLLLVGRKEISPLDLKKILEIKDRRGAGKTVSPNGLYFIGPQYPSHFEIPNITNSIV
jgi:tRNA pseudouridine38-40 synthase|tara:strand:+ start:500 stop:1282 length:783 start_codon:yes stop_codon:yes gene_type:complete